MRFGFRTKSPRRARRTERRKQIRRFASGDKGRTPSGPTRRRAPPDVRLWDPARCDSGGGGCLSSRGARTAPGFRFKDWGDHKFCLPSGWPSPTDQAIGPRDGATTAFQLMKRYASGSQTWLRTITKPVAARCASRSMAEEQLSGWSVDTTNGVVTFDSGPPRASPLPRVYAFDVPVRFDTDALDVTLDLERARLDHLHPAVEIRR